MIRWESFQGCKDLQHPPIIVIHHSNKMKDENRMIISTDAEVASDKITSSYDKTSMKQVSRECMFLGSLSRHNKDLEWRTLKPPQRVTALRSWIDRVIALRQISVTALFYLEDSRKLHFQGVRACRSKDTRRRAPQLAGGGGERERELALAPLFICFSLPGPVLCKLGQPGVLFVLPKVLTPVLGASFVPFSLAFPFLVL